MAFSRDDAKLLFRITADSSDADRAFTRVEANIEGLASSVGRSAGIWSALGTAGVDALQRIGGAMLRAGGAVLDYSASLEQLRISFGTLLGSTTKANALLAQLQKFAATTPFDVKDLASVAQRMISVGIETQKVIPLMRDLGNIVAATGEVSAERLEGISTALTQMISKTKVSAEEMEQLAERQVPAWKILSDATGKSQAELRKLAEQGKITSDVMVAALQKISQQKFGDAMKAQAGTFSGSLNVIKNLLMQWSATAFRPFFEELSKLGAKIAATMQAQEKTAKPAAQKLGYSLGVGIGDGLKRYFQSSEWTDIIKDYVTYGMSAPGLTKFGMNVGRGIVDGTRERPVPRSPEYNRPTEIVNNQNATVDQALIAQAETARKDAEERAQRDLAARLEIWKNYGQAVIAEFDRVNQALTESFEQTGDAAGFRAGIESLNQWLISETTRVQTALMELEKAQADEQKKTTAEVALIKQQQIERVNEWERKAGEARSESEKLITENQKRELEKREKLTQESVERELAIYKSRSDLAIAQADADRRIGLINEVDYQKLLAREKLSVLEKEKELLLKREQTADILARIKILDNEMTVQMLDNTAKITLAIEELNSAIGGRAGGGTAGEIGPGDGEPGTDSAGGGLFDQWTASWNNFFSTVSETAPTLGSILGDVAGIMQNAFASIAQGIGSVVENWVLMGETGPAVMRKLLASALASLAAEAATRAIFELAMGFATLFFNPAESAAHFTAAAIFGTIAVGAALAGRAVAGDAFKRESASGAATGANSQGSRTTGGGAYSGQEPTTINGGRNAPAGAAGTIVIRDKSGMFDALFTAAFERNGPMRQRLIQEFGT